MSMRIRMYVRVHQDSLRPYMRHLWTLRDAGKQPNGGALRNAKPPFKIARRGYSTKVPMDERKP